jgi:hypothetical protein
MSTPHDALEEREHLQHAAEDPFDRRVAMTMTVVAALLAVVTLLSHRAHTTTLRLTTLAAVHKGKASDEWNYYQAKNNRSHAYETALELAGIVAKEGGASAKLQAARERWTGQQSKYKTELPEQRQRAENFDKQADAAELEAEQVHRQADRFDLGELGVELALILSSIAILTKRRGYWLGSIGFATVGAGIAATAFLL